MSKRGNGEGTIYYSEKLNKWVGQFTVGKKANGKLNRKSVYGNTRKEVKEKMTIALSQIQTKSFIEKSDITIVSLGKEIIDNKFNANILSQSSYGRALMTLKHIEKSNIANLKIQDVKATELQDFINTKKNYTNSYIDKIYQMLMNIFKEGIKRDIIVKDPLINVIKPKSFVKTKEVEALTVEEQKLFINELQNEQYKNIFLLALHSRYENWRNLSITTK